VSPWSVNRHNPMSPISMELHFNCNCVVVSWDAESESCCTTVKLEVSQIGKDNANEKA
jgi:hypothetical protein